MNRQNQNAAGSFSGFLDDLLSGNGGRIFRDELFPNEWFKNQNVLVNIKEKEDQFALEVVAPGLSKEAIKLQVNDNVLNISFEAEKKEASENKDTEKILKHEFELRSFKRSFKLGNKVDVDKISAKYENGILYLTLPKKETEKANNKSITID